MVLEVDRKTQNSHNLCLIILHKYYGFLYSFAMKLRLFEVSLV